MVFGATPDPLEDRQHHALGLAEERGEQVLGGDLGVVPLPREALGGADRLLVLRVNLFGSSGIGRHLCGSDGVGQS